VSDLERIGDDLSGLLQRLGLPRPDAAARLAEAWEELAGEPWASHSRPSGLRAGVLRVAASDPAAAALLRYRVTELVERLADTLGSGTVTSVEVTVARRQKGR
jgi:predicted nucleic acid-binding Zn ribbon protein